MINERIIKAAKSACSGDPWPLLGEVVNLWVSSKLGVNLTAPDGKVELPGTPEQQAIDTFYTQLKQRKFGLLLIIGRRGSGKTALSLRLVEFLGKRRNYAIGMSQEKLPSYMESLTDAQIENIDSAIPNNCTVVIDDAGLFYGSDSSRTAVTKVLQRLLDICRHKEVVLIVNVQRAASLSRQLCDPDIVFLKPPSLMYMRSEDENLKRFMKPAEQAFAELAEKEGVESWKSHVYVVSDDFEGMLATELPSGWSKEVSTNKS